MGTSSWFLKAMLWLIATGIAYIIAGPWGIIAVLALTILWVVVDAVVFAAKNVAARYEQGSELMRAAEEGERERAEARAPAVATTSTIEQWTYRKDSPDNDGNYFSYSLHFATMTLRQEIGWGFGPTQKRRGEFAVRRSTTGTWEIMPTWATFQTLLDAEDPAERAEIQGRGREWSPLGPEEIVGAVETAYQRYIHSAG